MFTDSTKDEAAECAKWLFANPTFRRRGMTLSVHPDQTILAHITAEQYSRCKTIEELQEVIEVEFAIALLRGAGNGAD